MRGTPAAGHGAAGRAAPAKALSVHHARAADGEPEGAVQAGRRERCTPSRSIFGEDELAGRQVAIKPLARRPRWPAQVHLAHAVKWRGWAHRAAHNA
jgi:hypothetical protein